MNEEKKLALLIDSDNVSAKYAQFILQEASKYGEIIYKRVYGDWERNFNTGWRIPAMNNSILPIQQNSYITGKNATDFSMIIDAMDILYTGKVDGFVLVTSDSDFTRLAIRLREAGMLVIGIGALQTPIAFTASCHYFSYLDQVCDNIGDNKESALRKDVLDYVKENDDGKLDLVKISAYLTSRYGSIDYAAFGYKRLSTFIDSFPELRRNSNFVLLKDRSAAKKAKALPSASEIAAVITEYLKQQNGAQSNLSKVNEYVTKKFGKVDFVRFGSKKFARFIDKRSEFVRRGSDIFLASALSAVSSQTESPVKTVAEPAELKKPEKKDEPEKNTLRITSQLFAMEVQKYASDNMPNGGNLGQLNNMLLEKYGKSYVSELGFSDFSTAAASVTGVSVAKNFVRVAEAESVKPAENTAQKSKKPSKPTEPVKAGNEEDVADAVQKPEINAVKRDIFAFTEQNADNASLGMLGHLLTRKYGQGYLKKLGFTTMKKLISSINGVSVKDNNLSFNKKFIKRTRDIEKLVYDFAHGDGKHSIKALSSKLKAQFEGFDLADYGYTKYSDFINAMDGVRANGYYVEADD